MSSMHGRIGIVCLGLVVWTHLAWADSLKFRWKEIAVGDVWGDARNPIVFRFVNEGRKKVRVLDVKTGCDCAAVKQSTLSCEPGAAGELTVEFNAEGRMGAQRRTMIVTTDEDWEPVYYLTFVANVRPLFAVSSRVVTWSGPEDGASKKIMLQAEPTERITIKSLEFDPALIAVTFGQVIERKAFEIVLTPVRLAVAATVPITIRVHVDGRPDQKSVIFARLK